MGVFQVCKSGFNCTILAAFNVSSYIVYDLLHSVHEGLGIYAGALLILYVYLKGLGLGLFYI